MILNKYMGPPPETFSWEGKVTTPIAFLTDVLKLDPDDYVATMSTPEFPFYVQEEFKVPDTVVRVED